MSQLEFNEQVAQQMEVIYSRRDLLRRRELVHEALGASPGERILDVGCGPGFYVTELLERVGPDGSVVGVDASPAMLAVAAHRAEGHANVEFHEGDATALPVDDADFDRALSVQVLEYVPDVPAALAELHRVLRPGGCVLLWDVDWATVSWHSGDPARMERVLRAWDEHLSDPSLPRTLAPRMRAAGFEDVELQGHTFATADLSPETYAGAGLPLIQGFVAGRDDIGPDVATAWADEQHELADRGEAFFACVQFCFTGRRPG